MATACFTSSPLITAKMPILRKKPVLCQNVMMIPKQRGQRISVQISTSRTHMIRSSSTNKVFEDGSTGVVCYRDDYGEIICEGYDEGPRDAEVVELFPSTKWHLLVHNQIDWGAASASVSAAQENICNGFNSCC